MDLTKLMEQAKKMQQDLADMENELNDTIYEGAGPEGEFYPYTKDETRQILESLNELGVVLHVVDHTVVYLCFYS